MQDPNFPSVTGEAYLTLELDERGSRAYKQVKGLTKGPLEVHRDEDSVFSTVYYFHRSARDYIPQAEPKMREFDDSLSEFDGSFPYDRILLARAVHMRHDLATEANNEFSWLEQMLKLLNEAAPSPEHWHRFLRQFQDAFEYHFPVGKPGDCPYGRSHQELGGNFGTKCESLRGSPNFPFSLSHFFSARIIFKDFLLTELAANPETKKTSSNDLNLVLTAIRHGHWDFTLALLDEGTTLDDHTLIKLNDDSKYRRPLNT